MNKPLKNVFILLCCVAMLVLLLAACKPSNITVIFDPNYENASLLPRTGMAGSSFQAPTVTRNGYEFDGWYKSRELRGRAEIFPQKLTVSTTFYAKWNEVTPEPDPTPEPEPITLVSISAVYSGGEIFVGAQLNTAYVSVSATYSDNSSKQVSGFTLSTTSFEVAGDQTVTVTYTENGVTKTTTFTVTVVVEPEPITLVSISAVYSGGEIFVGAQLNKASVAVTATYSDNSSKQVSGFTLSATSFEVAGDQTVTVTYTENGVTKTTTFTVTVVVEPEPITLVSISAVYSGGEILVGAQLNKDFVAVTATYSDSSSKQVRGFTLSATSFEAAGDQTVTVTYTENGVTKTTTFTVTVVEPEPIVLSSITAVYGGKSVNIGEQPDKSLLTVTAHYSDGSSKTVNNFSTGPFDSSTTGEKNWEISYTDDGVTQSVIITIKVIEVKEPQDNVYDVEVIRNENLSIHFLELGNGSIGDCVYIKAGDTDILIDAGSKRNSAPTLANYINQYCEDGILEYVIATHAHEDHIAGFVGEGSTKGLFDLFSCETIIEFAKYNTSSQVSKDYFAKRTAQVQNGANCYTALQCVNNENGAKKVYDLTPDGSITMEILDQKYYHQKMSSGENDHSVCVLISQGDNHYLFTGDLEKAGEESLVQLNPNLPEVELYKGGHHGSSTSSNEVLMKKVKPKCVCVCSCMGSVEYSQYVYYGTFPTQDFINRVAPYTDKVYVTTYMSVKYANNKYTNDQYRSANGNIVFACTDGQITMYFSNNNLKLKDTDWFKEYRVCPDYWK